MKKNKRAISLMLSYVLLIVIGLAMASAVYFIMKFYANIDEGKKCKENVEFEVKEIICNSPAAGQVTIKLSNMGNWKIDGFIIKGSDAASIRPYQNLAEADPNLDTSGMMSVFPPGNALNLQAESSYIFSLSGLTTLTEISIQAVRIEEDKNGEEYYAVCEDSIIMQKVSC